MAPGEFLPGMNVEGDDLLTTPEEIVRILQPTAIRWIRVHLLPNRSLNRPGRRGLSYLDAIEYLCKNGYNIVAPIEVGYRANVGIVASKHLDRFAEESYDHSLHACKQISEVVRRHRRQVIFGVENEVDPKAWLTQAMPKIAWRQTFEAWATLASDIELRYKRLNNILRGAVDADPEPQTMTNVLAVDWTVYFRSLRVRVSNFLDKHSIWRRVDEIFGGALEEMNRRFRLPDRVLDWKAELKHLKGHLDVDYVGIDTYPNYFVGYPVHGHDTGDKVREAFELTGKPVLNSEFGYSTYRGLVGTALLELMGRHSASKMQLQFFRNTLESINESPSVGTFPWVLFSRPRAPVKPPKHEGYFGLWKRSNRGRWRKEPAFDYYVSWLAGRVAQTARPSIASGEWEAAGRGPARPSVAR